MATYTVANSLLSEVIILQADTQRADFAQFTSVKETLASPLSPPDDS